MLIKLTEQEQKTLLTILNNMTIKVSDYPAIQRLLIAVSTPVKEKEKDGV